MEQLAKLGNAPLDLGPEGDLVFLKTILEDGSDLKLVLGLKEEACEEMCQFLAALDYEGVGRRKEQRR